MLRKLKTGGEILAATDWREYGEQMLEVLPNSFLSKRPSWRPMTKYERKGINAGREIMEVSAKK
jgi:tRNA (guanine-N7-)-methyltransferase